MDHFKARARFRDARVGMVIVDIETTPAILRQLADAMDAMRDSPAGASAIAGVLTGSDVTVNIIVDQISFPL